MNVVAVARAARLATCAVALLAAGASAQGSTLHRPSLAVFGGVGAALTVAQPGLARHIGRAGIVGVEADSVWTSGFARRLGFRLEGGLTSEKVGSSSGPISGDVQTAHLAALASMRIATSDGREIYALAGPIWARPSDKLVLSAASTETPGSSFEQTTHQTAPGAMLGLGVAWRLRSAVVRSEARWMSVATNRRATRVLPLMVSIALPIASLTRPGAAR
jgi:hypothetical protein